MDAHMDGIDDILGQLDADAGADADADADAADAAPRRLRDLQALTRRWVAERCAPELLPWPADGLVEDVSRRIRDQIERVEEMTGDMDPATNFDLIVIQTELERFKYLVRSYLRARIAKIDKHTLHYLSSAPLRARLSPTELAYATRHQALLHNHYLSSFLAAFPPQLQHLNDAAGSASMVDAPDVDAPVFVRMLRPCTVYARGTDADNALPAETGDVLILRWSSAHDLVDAADAELV